MLVQACPVLRYGGARAPGVCHSEEQSDEESQAIVRILRSHPDKRDSIEHVESENPGWVDLRRRPWIRRTEESYVGRPEKLASQTESN